LEDNQKNPGYFFLARPGVYLAHGRDPHFFPWQDTVQINFYSPELRKAHIEELLKIAQYCDGVRCDMAMLGLNSVFEKTWHPFLKNTPQATTEYWSDVIGAVKKKYPRFIFIAEAYWDLQWQLQKLGFDFTYDKKFYDLLFAANTSEIIGHLNADSDYRNRSVHFIENHDEARAVTHFGREKSFAAAAVMMTNPGLRFIYDGQIEGKTIRLPVQLTREPFEVGNPEAEEFYNLILLYSHHESLHEGEFRILPVISAWGNNISYKNVLAWAWVYKKELRMVVVNYSSEWSQAKVLLPKEWLKKCLVLRDWYSLDIFERSHEELQAKGLYIDLGPWSMHLFESRI
jgi:glycosidase